MTALYSVSTLITHVISSSGYAGIFLFMLISSSAIPIPSEIIMLFSGFLVTQGQISLVGIILTGAFGSLAGSLILYYIGYYGGQPLVEKYGKYLHISSKDLARADRFFLRYADAANFIGRLIPIIRSFISFPSGVAKADIKKFIFYSFLGSLIWSIIFGVAGYKLGQNWDSIHPYFQKADQLLVIIIVALIGWFFYRHFRREKAV
jgi:membrane protein DedA with SNARE-associated domain